MAKYWATAIVSSTIGKRTTKHYSFYLNADDDNDAFYKVGEYLTKRRLKYYEDECNMVITNLDNLGEESMKKTNKEIEYIEKLYKTKTINI